MPRVVVSESPTVVRVTDESVRVVVAAQEGPAGPAGPTGAAGPNQVSDATALGTLTDAVADALFVLAGDADGTLVRKVVLAALARAFLGTGVVPGTLVVRQPGGAAGTDEVRVSHDGTRGEVRSCDGPIRLYTGSPSSTTHALEIVATTAGCSLTWLNSGADLVVMSAGGGRLASGGFRDGVLNAWSLDASGLGWGGSPASRDVALVRAAARVWGLTDAATAGGTLASAPLNVTLTASVDNWAPAAARTYRLTTTAPLTVSGLSVSQVNGQECWVENVGPFPVHLPHRGAGAATANQFALSDGEDAYLEPGDRAHLLYSSTAGRWAVQVAPSKRPSQLYFPYWESPAGTKKLTRCLRGVHRFRRMQAVVDVGTLTLSVTLNGTPVDGWTAVTVTAVKQTFTPASFTLNGTPVTVNGSANDDLEVTFSGAGTGLTLGFSE